MIHLDTYIDKEYTLLFVDTGGGNPKSTDIQKIKYPEINGTKGLIYSIPIPETWAAATIIDHYRNKAAWFGAYDPKLGGAVIYQSFNPQKVVSEFLDLKFPCLKCFELGIDKRIKKGAKYPYCTEHTEIAPHRH